MIPGNSGKILFLKITQFELLLIVMCVYIMSHDKHVQHVSFVATVKKNDVILLEML